MATEKKNLLVKFEINSVQMVLWVNLYQDCINYFPRMINSYFIKKDTSLKETALVHKEPPKMQQTTISNVAAFKKIIKHGIS